jgi:hypothetical protein
MLVGLYRHTDIHTIESVDISASAPANVAAASPVQTVGYICEPSQLCFSVNCLGI